MTRILSLFPLVLLACGQKLAGTYSGSVLQGGDVRSIDAAGRLSSTTVNNTGVVDVIVTQRGDTLTVVYQGCTFDAKLGVAGSATASVIECPFPGSPGTTFRVENALINFTSDTLGWTFIGTTHGAQGEGGFTSNSAARR